MFTIMNTLEFIYLIYFQFRKIWGTFGDLSSNDARRKFIEKLEKSVPVFAPFMIAHQKEKEENERKK